MRQKMMKILAFLLFAIIAGHSANVWKNGIQVKGVQALQDGRFIIYLPAGTDPNCKENGKLLYVESGQNGVNDEGLKNLLATSLTAFTTGNKVSVLYDNDLGGNSTSMCYVQTLYVGN